MGKVRDFRFVSRGVKEDRRGTAALEFAIIAPVLILILGGLFTVSGYIRAHTTTQAYAREAARGVALGYMTLEEAQRSAETNASRDLHVAVSASVDPATKGDPNDQDVKVTLMISDSEMRRLSPFLGIVTGKVSSTVVVRNMVE